MKRLKFFSVSSVPPWFIQRAAAFRKRSMIAMPRPVSGTGSTMMRSRLCSSSRRIAAKRRAATIEAGSIWINGWFIGGVQAPTGGIKDSGVGRERGLPGIRNYLSIKNIGIRL